MACQLTQIHTHTVQLLEERRLEAKPDLAIKSYLLILFVICQFLLASLDLKASPELLITCQKSQTDLHLHLTRIYSSGTRKTLADYSVVCCPPSHRAQQPEKQLRWAPNGNRGSGKDMVPHTVDLASLDRIADSPGALSINLAANAEGSAENLLDGTLKSLGERLEPHRPGNVDNLIKSDGLVVLDVLLLLPVTRGLLERPDDKRRGGRDDRDRGLTVLDGELDGHTETLLYAGKKSFVRKSVPQASFSRYLWGREVYCPFRMRIAFNQGVFVCSVCKSWWFHTQSPVALAISSPTFLGERPRGPILGARVAEAPTSPPVARRVLYTEYPSVRCFVVLHLCAV